MKKAQTSMEYMTIIVFVTVILIPLVMLYYTQYEGTNEQIRSNQADQIGRKILDVSESVYYLGEGSKTTIKVYMPPSVEEVVLGNKELVFVMRTRMGITEVVRSSTVDINGSIDHNSGMKIISIESMGDYIQINSN